MTVGLRWAEFESQEPAFAAAGRRLLVGADGVAIGFLATAARSGRPRLAPVCPIFAADDLYLCAVETSPKVGNLRANPAYSLHAFLGKHDEEFQVQGRAAEVVDTSERASVHGAIPFPSFDEQDPIFRLDLERAVWVHWENPGQSDTRQVKRRWVARAAGPARAAYFEPAPGSRCDPSELVERCIEAGARSLLLDAPAIPGAFFDLSTGHAGELLHHLGKYRLRLAVVVPDPSLHSQPFQALLREANAGDEFRSFSSRPDALEWILSG